MALCFCPGYVYAGALFVALMVMTFCENAYFDVCTKCGVRMKGGLIPEIYRHARAAVANCAAVS